MNRTADRNRNTPLWLESNVNWADPEHGKQAVLQELPAGEIFSSLALSVVEMNCAYTAERSCKLPVFFFYGMDEPAQEPDDVDRFLVRPPEKIILCFSECGREVYAVTVFVSWFFLFLFVFGGSLVCQKDPEVVHGEPRIDLLLEELRVF